MDSGEIPSQHQLLSPLMFLRRHFYQYAGIRYVCSENDYHDKWVQIMYRNMWKLEPAHMLR